jgi:hypothetical protein
MDDAREFSAIGYRRMLGNCLLSSIPDRGATIDLFISDCGESLGYFAFALNLT